MNSLSRLLLPYKLPLAFVPLVALKKPALAPLPEPPVIVDEAPPVDVLLNALEPALALLETPPIVLPEEVVDGLCGSSSKSRNFEKIFWSDLCLSSSSINDSGIANVRFLLTKLEVPTRPETAQSIPVH